MVNRLADIVQQTGPFRLFDVDAEFGRHDSAEERDFERMLQNILTVGSPVFQSADQLDDLSYNFV